MRGTFRRIKPFALAAVILIPLLLVAAVTWISSSGGTLNVTIVDASGKTTTYSQAIGQDGAEGIVEGEAGARATYKVSGLPGDKQTMTVTPISSNGKVGTPCIIRVGPGTAKINMAGKDGRIVRTATLVSRRGPPPGTAMLYSMAMAFGLFGIYFVVLCGYSLARLRPLTAGLPRSNERISMREGVNLYATKMSNKLLILFGVGAGMSFVGNSIRVIDAATSHHPIGDTVTIVGYVSSVLMIGYFFWILALKLRSKQRAL